MNHVNPITKAEDDLLGRYSLAQEITTSILQTFNTDHESFVVGINGSWGSGKSSILKFINTELIPIVEQQKTRKLRENELYKIVVNFNPWMFSNQIELQAAFLSEIKNSLRLENESLKSLKSDFNKIGKALGKLTSLIPDPIYKGLASGGAKLLEVLTDKKSTGYEVIKTNKDKIDECLNESRIQLIIFIDDIDRLTPTEVAEVFKMIKLNVGFKNTLFFLAYDAEFVSSALEDLYKSNGKSYLEKIVQVDYTLPAILKEDMLDIFINQLKNLFKEINIFYDFNLIEERWNTSNLKDYFKTLRHVYRFINSLKLRLPAIHREINITDFLLLEAIRLFDFPAYNLLQTDYDDLKKMSSVITRFIQPTAPIVDWLFKGDSLLSSYPEQLNKRFNNDNYYERYFSFKLAKKDIVENDIQNFLLYSTTTDMFFKLKREGNLDHFLLRISTDKLNKIYTLKRTDYAQSILVFINNYPELWNNSLQYFNAIYNLIQCSSDKLKAITELMKTLLEGAKGERLHVPAFMVYNHLLKTDFFSTNETSLYTSNDEFRKINSYFLDNKINEHLKLFRTENFNINKTFINFCLENFPTDYEFSIFSEILNTQSGFTCLCDLIAPSNNGKVAIEFTNIELLKKLIPPLQWKPFMTKVNKASHYPRTLLNDSPSTIFVLNNVSELKNLILG